MKNQIIIKTGVVINQNNHQKNSNGKLIDNISNEDATKNKDKYYFAIGKYEDEKSGRIMKLKFGTPNKPFERPEIKRIYKAFYRGDGVGKPETFKINTILVKLPIEMNKRNFKVPFYLIAQIS